MSSFHPHPPRHVSSAFTSHPSIPTLIPTSIPTTGRIRQRGNRHSLSHLSSSSSSNDQKELQKVSKENNSNNINNINDDYNNNFNETKKDQIQFELMEIDARHDSRTPLIYDPIIERYIDNDPSNSNNNYNSNYNSNNSNNNSQRTNNQNKNKLKQKIQKLFSNAFLPEGVTHSYYNFIKWRIIQRFISANVHVFGTQSLLMGLGLQTAKHHRKAATVATTAVATTATATATLGLSAAFNWVLKDALGKIVRMIWASKMGRKFDPDAKRWRYRSSLLFALGNGLEVMTYVCPSLFLILAATANACKQISMLTSSATRNALYNSFRDGTRENIGDITAKGEAQIAFVDLFGIASGVCLSRAIGTSVRSVISIWIALQILDVFCVYKEIRAVVFRMLNFERLWIVVNQFINDIYDNEDQSFFINGSSSSLSTTTTTSISAPSTYTSASASTSKSKPATVTTAKNTITNKNTSDVSLPTPSMIAKHEKIFMPPSHLARRAISFGSLSRAKLSPDELHELISIFENEKYLLVVGRDVKNKNKRRKWMWQDLMGVKNIRRRRQRRRRTQTSLLHTNNKKGKDNNNNNDKAIITMDQLKQEAQENCHIVLHADATNADIVKSTLALALLRSKLANAIPTIDLEEDDDQDQDQNQDSVVLYIESIQNQRSRDCMSLIHQSKIEASQLFGLFLKVLSVKGWATPARFMFGRVSMRTEWPIQTRQSKQANS